MGDIYSDKHFDLLSCSHDGAGDLEFDTQTTPAADILHPPRFFEGAGAGMSEKKDAKGLGSLPPDVQGSARMALRDVANSNGRQINNLEFALHEAAEAGILRRFVAVFNQELSKSGKGYKLVPAPIGANDWSAFNLTKVDQQGERVMATIHGIVAGPPAKPILSAKDSVLEASDPVKLRVLQKRLELDVKSGKSEAKEQLKQVETMKTFYELTHFSSPGCVNKLVQQAGEGNHSSRDALTAIVVPSNSKVSWQSLVRHSDHYFATAKIPDIRNPDRTEEIKLEAVKGLRVLCTEKGLSRAETSALALCLIDALRKKETKLATAIRNLLALTYDKEIDGQKNPKLQTEYARRVESTLDGLYDVLARPNPLLDETCRRELIVQYAKAADSANNRVVCEPGGYGAGARMFDIGRNIEKHLELFKDRATKGDIVALEVLAVFAGGAAKHNSAVNTFFIPLGKSKQEPGDCLARDCRDVLVEYSSKNEANRKLILDILTSKHQIDILKDRSRKLETLGLVAGQNAPDTPAKVREILRAALAERTCNRSALTGLIALGSALELEDLRAIARNLSPEAIEPLRETAGGLPPRTGQALAELIALTIIDKQGKHSTEQRVQAIEALAALGKHHTTLASLSALQSLGGELGRKNLIDHLTARKYDYPTKTEVEIATGFLQKSAVQALLSISESNVDQRVKAEAFRAIATRSLEGFSQDERAAIGRRLVSLMENNPRNVSIRHGVPKLVYDIDKDVLNPPATDKNSYSTSLTRIAAGFRDAGADASDEVLRFFSRKAIEIHGKETVEQVLSKLALYNALPPRIRLQVTARAELLPAGQELNLAGHSVSYETINKLPDELRKKITGSSDKLAPGPWKGSAGAVIEDNDFNKLPVELRKALTASDEPLDARLVLGLLANDRIRDTHSAAHILLDQPSLEQQIDELRLAAKTRLKEQERVLASLQKCKAEVVEGLRKHAKDGVGWLNKLTADREMRIALLLVVQVGVGGVFTGGYTDEKWSKVQDEFIRKQNRFVEVLSRNVEPAISHQSARVQQARGEKSELELACANKKYFELVYQGRTHEADKHALDVFSQYGRITFAAPAIARGLSLSGEGMYSNAMRRLNAEHETVRRELVLNPFLGSDKRKDLSTPSAGFLVGTALLQLIHSKKTGKDCLDIAAIQNEAFLSIDNDPDVRKLNGLASDIGQRLSVLYAEIGIMQANHDRFAAVIKDANVRARELGELLSKLSPYELSRLHAMRELLSQSLIKATSNDSPVRELLRARLEALDSALMLLDPAYKHEKLQADKIKQISKLQEEYNFLQRESWKLAQHAIPPEHLKTYVTDHPGWELTKLQRQYWIERRDAVAEQLVNLRGALYQRKNLQKLLAFLDTPEAKNESTFRTWLKTDGVELLVSLGAAAAATAILVATFSNPVTGAIAIFGSEALGGLAVAAAGTFGAMSGREGTREVQRWLGVTNHGALLGDTLRGAKEDMPDGSERDMTLLNDVLPSYLKEFAAGTGVGWAGCALGHQIGRGLRFLGERAASVFLAESGPAAARLASNLATIESAAGQSTWFSRFATSVLAESRTTAALTPASIILEQGINAGGRHYGYKLSEGNVLTSFLAATALSVPFGAMHPTVVHQEGPHKPGAPAVILEYKGSVRDANRYMVSAMEHGSLFRVRPDGTFLEITKDGLVVEWRRPGSSAVAHAGEKFAGSFDALKNTWRDNGNRVTSIDPEKRYLFDLRAAQVDRTKEILRKKGEPVEAHPAREKFGTLDIFRTRRDDHVANLERGKRWLLDLRAAQTTRAQELLRYMYSNQEPRSSHSHDDLNHLSSRPANRFGFDLRAAQIEWHQPGSTPVDAGEKFGGTFDAFFSRRDIIKMDLEQRWILERRAEQNDNIKEILHRRESSGGPPKGPTPDRLDKATTEALRQYFKDLVPALAGRPDPSSLVDRDTLRRVNSRLQELTQPLTQLESKVNDLEIEYFRRTRDLLAKKPEISVFREKVDLLHAEADTLRKGLLKNEEFRRLNIVRSLAAGEFPPGEHLVKLKNGNTVRLLIGERTFLDSEGKPHRQMYGEAVPESHVREILAELERSPIIPDQVTIASRRTALGGSMGTVGFVHEIYINARKDSQPLLSRRIFNHETGHLFDHGIWRTTADAAIQEKVHKAYVNGLESGVADTAQKHLRGSLDKTAYIEALKKNPDIFLNDLSTRADEMRYFASRNEVFAEMYMLYAEQQRIQAHTGRALSYTELLNHFSSPERGSIMKHFHEMFEILSTEVFPKTILAEASKHRAQRNLLPAERDGKLSVERLPLERTADGDRYHLRNINKRLDELLRPVTELEREIDDLERDYLGKNHDKRTTHELLALRKRLMLLAEKSDATRTELLKNEEFRRLNIIRSLAAGQFPPGEHMVKLRDGNTVKLLIGETTIVDRAGKLQRTMLGGPVPEAHVREILEQLERAHFIPDQVSICSEKDSLGGALNKVGSTYQIWINARHDRHPSFARMTFNHETGHLFDYVIWRKSAAPAIRDAVHNAYLKGLEGGLADTVQGHLKEKLDRRAFIEILSWSPDSAIKQMQTPEDHMRYLSSQSEVFAEMYALYLEQQRIKANTGKELTYTGLLNRSTGLVAPMRISIMNHFEEMFGVLSKEVFPQIKSSKNRTIRGEWITKPAVVDDYGLWTESRVFKDAATFSRAEKPSTVRGSTENTEIGTFEWNEPSKEGSLLKAVEQIRENFSGSDALSKERLPLEWIEKIEDKNRKAALQDLAEKLLKKGTSELALYDYMQGRRPEPPPGTKTAILEGANALEKFGQDRDAIRLAREVVDIVTIGEPTLIEAVRLQREIYAAQRELAHEHSVDANGAESAKRQLETARKALESLKDSTAKGNERLSAVIERIESKTRALNDAQQHLAELLHNGSGKPAHEEAVAAARQKVLAEAKKLHSDADFNALKAAFAAERNGLSAGEYFAKYSDGSRLKIIVKEGSYVKHDCIDKLLNRVADNGIKPNELVFDLRHPYPGSAEVGSVLIRTRTEDIHYMITFDHESGHLFDFSLNQRSAEYQAFLKTWRTCVQENADLLFRQASMIDDKLPAGGVEAFKRELLNNPRFQGGTRDELTRYYASSSELLAEMFALYMHEQRMRITGKGVSEYSALLHTQVAPRDEHRAVVMLNFKELYRHLKQSLFQKLSAQQNAKTLFLAKQANESSFANLKRCFTEYGANSKEFQNTCSEYRKNTMKQAREALADALFTNEHGISAADFDPGKLSPEMQTKHQSYRRFAEVDYNPQSHRALPGEHPQPLWLALRCCFMEQAFRLFNENSSLMESLARKRADAKLASFIELRLKDFLHNRSTSLAHDIFDAYHNGLDRADPLGQLALPGEANRARSLTQESVMVDLFTAWMEKERMTRAGKTNISFPEVLRESFGQARADQLQDFPELWRKLDRDVFPSLSREIPAKPSHADHQSRTALAGAERTSARAGDRPSEFQPKPDKVETHPVEKQVDRHVSNAQMQEIWNKAVESNGNKPLQVVKGYYEAGVRQVSETEHPRGLILSTTESPIKLRKDATVKYSDGRTEVIKAGTVLGNGVQLSPDADAGTSGTNTGETRTLPGANFIVTGPDGKVLREGRISGALVIDKGQLAKAGEYIVSRASVDLETGKPRIDTYTNRDLSRWTPVDGKPGIFAPRLEGSKPIDVIKVPEGSHGTFDVSYGGTAPFHPGDLIVREDKPGGMPAFRRISQGDALETYRAADATTEKSLAESAASLQKKYPDATIVRAMESAKD